MHGEGNEAETMEVSIGMAGRDGGVSAETVWLKISVCLWVFVAQVGAAVVRVPFESGAAIVTFLLVADVGKPAEGGADIVVLINRLDKVCFEMVEDTAEIA